MSEGKWPKLRRVTAQQLREGFIWQMRSGGERRLYYQVWSKLPDGTFDVIEPTVGLGTIHPALDEYSEEPATRTSAERIAELESTVARLRKALGDQKPWLLVTKQTASF